jgi:hypothetical protein
VAFPVPLLSVLSCGVGYKCSHGTSDVMAAVVMQSIAVQYVTLRYTVKADAARVHATKALGGREDIVPTQALDGGEWSASRLGRALAPGKRPPVPIVPEAGWAPEPVWTQRLEEKLLRLCLGSNLDRQVVEPVATHYTD